MSKASTRFEPMETLQPEDVTVGSIVLYVSLYEPHRVCPAMVNCIVRDGVVNLHAFLDETGHQAVVLVRNVKYDASGKPGTWRWE